MTATPRRAAAPPAGPVDPELAGFLDYLRTECGLSGNTLAAYRRDLDLLVGFLRGRPLSGAARRDLLAFVSDQARRYSPATVARRVAALHTFFRYLRTENPGRQDPSSVLDRPGAWQRLPRILSVREVEELLAAPAAVLSGRRRRTRRARAMYLRDRALLETLYATGCRAAEVSGLELAGVNLDIGYVRCRGKGSKERLVPLGDKGRAALAEYLDRGWPELAGGRKANWVFLTRAGRRLGRIDVWRLVKRHLAVAGLSGQASTHTLRHSFATHMLRGGANLRAIQEMLGHASPATTQIYTHLDRRDLLEAHRKYHPRG